MYRPPNIPEDKANHFIYTQVFSQLVFVGFFYYLPQYALYSALAAGAALATLWEFAQYLTKSGEPSYKDALAGFLGTVVLLIPPSLLMYIK